MLPQMNIGFFHPPSLLLKQRHSGLRTAASSFSWPGLLPMQSGHPPPVSRAARAPALAICALSQLRFRDQPVLPFLCPIQASTAPALGTNGAPGVDRNLRYSLTRHRLGVFILCTSSHSREPSFQSHRQVIFAIYTRDRNP